MVWYVSGSRGAVRGPAGAFLGMIEPLGGHGFGLPQMAHVIRAFFGIEVAAVMEELAVQVAIH